jgi:signal transduction histidine kinase
MLHTIFRNLIFNAVKFSNNGDQVKITAVKENNKTMITIEDDGIGMDEQTINNLFNIENKRPIRGTGGESGSGLGLILTKEFIERHKGTINVESELGKGSTFTITLPQS